MGKPVVLCVEGEKYAAVTKDATQRSPSGLIRAMSPSTFFRTVSPSTLLKTVSLSNGLSNGLSIGRWTFYEAVKAL
jgi:hypothetical protein